MRNIFLIISVFYTFQLFAQKQQIKNLPNYDRKKLHFGFTVGINSMDFIIKKSADFINDETIYAIENNPQVGFHIGPVSNLRLGEHFDLRLLINLSFGQRDLTYWTVKDTTATTLTPHTMKIASTFIEFPLLLKYKAVRVNNFSPYIIGGLNPRLDMAARKKIKEEEMPKIRLENKDIYYELGFGIDFYLTYFKLSAELKYSVGILDVLARDGTPYTSSIDKMNSRMMMFSLHFE